jgi:hypothetical protein
MTEPDVALTDYAVALEAALLIWLLPRGRGHANKLRLWFVLFFASVGAASVLGGTAHGFFLDAQAPGHAMLWTATLLAMGVTALSMWAIGATLLFSRRVVRWVLVAAAAQGVSYAAVVLFVSQQFWVGIADNLPAILFLLIALGVTARRHRQPILWLAAAGPVLVLVAAVLQQLRVGMHPVYFNHNAVYHVLQAVAIYLLFLGGRWLLTAGSDLPKSPPELARHDRGAPNDEPSHAL